MSVRVINIAKEHEVILGFLFPEYVITDSAVSVGKFITHRDIKTKREREALELCYEDCVFISSQIFDEFWDEEVIKRECLEFAHSRFKSRKKSVPVNLDLIQDCIKFIFDTLTEEQEQSIFELFDAFGTAQFPKQFLVKAQSTPVPVLISALNTFVGKILSADNSIYYKRKQILFKEKIHRNIIKALDEMWLRDKDEFGLSNVKFYMDLCKE